MVAPVQLAHCHHVEYLGILVGLRAVKVAAVHHLRARLQHARQVAKVRARVHEAAANRVGVSRDRTDDADARVLRLLHVVDEEVGQQEVAQVVHAHRHLEAVVGEARLRVGRQVDGGVADEPVEAARAEELGQVGREVLDRRQRRQLQLHRRVVRRLQPGLLRLGGHCKRDGRSTPSGEAGVLRGRGPRARRRPSSGIGLRHPSRVGGLETLGRSLFSGSRTAAITK
mmetsp:Transcript_71567/g.215119  ORF Transcript_71567/g.215119 Transcript_71567/m.215119 type:complete len:227 (+) Transcript_71567:636-1316(+)